MTATATAFRPRYYSEIIKEPGGTLDDCSICSSLVLFEMATLREGVTRNDGTLMDTIRLRELRDEAGLKPDGPLRLNDIAQYLAFLSTKVGIDPPFRLDYYPGHPGGTLRVTWDEFRQRVSNGSVAILLGNPVGVKDPASPLRTKQNNDDYGHAIAVFDGGPNGATVYDALTRKGPDWKGERVRWDDLRQFTEARKNGDRLYGTPATVACALAVTGADTQAERTTRTAKLALTKAGAKLSEQRDQTALATDERDQARRDLATAQARILELEGQAPDCSAQDRKIADALAVLTR